MTNSNQLYPDAFLAAKAHARSVYPQESCGLIVKGEYIPCENIAENPEQDFEIAPAVYNQHLIEGGVDVIVHSHPGGPMFPSLADMEGQVQTNKTWAIIPLDEDRIGDPILWGGDLPIAPLIGREFIHGVHDCYSLVHDTFRLGAEELEKQGIIEWPFKPIELMNSPREDCWWNGEANIYEDGYAKAGFVKIDQWDARPGDCFLMKIRSSKYNHAGVLIGEGLIMHHLPMRLSRREPAGLWGRQAGLWLRYEGPTDAA